MHVSDKARQVLLFSMTAKRVGVFIDGGYIDHMNRHGFPGMADYRKLIQFVTKDEGELTFAGYYDCMPYQTQNPTEEEKRLYSRKRRFIQTLSKLPRMTVRLGKTQMRDGKSPVQKRVDVLLALDVARAAWKGEVDTVILIAGDSDFVPVLDEAKLCGVKTVLYYYCPAFNNDLIRSASEAHEITPDVWKEIVRFQ